MKNQIFQYVKLVRLHQYVKNLFIFMPLFFVGQFTNTDLLLRALIAFAAFSLSASAVYILNDYRDVEDDRLHPKKKERPIASGAVSQQNAIVLMFILLVLGHALMASISIHAFAVVLAYVVMNIAYSYYLKHIAILDITVIGIGFVLRLFVGSLATEISLSMWIVIMTFLLALFIGLAKRRDDFLIYLDTEKKMRKSMDGYNLLFIDSGMVIMASVVIVAYILYTTSPEVVERLQNDYIYTTALFVILGILRYMQITYVNNDSGSPVQIVLKDRFLQGTIVAWIITFMWIIYL